MSDSHYDLVIQHNASVEPVDRLVRDLLMLLDKKGDPYIEYKLSEGLQQNRYFRKYQQR